MATPTDDTYTAPSGATVYGGRWAPSDLPAWVPPPGYYADVPMVNDPVDLAPAIYSSGDMETAFSHWGGSAYLRNLGAYGSQVYRSAGHETAGDQPNIQFTLVCNFETLTWSIANVPAAANASNTFVDGYAPDGTPYNPHTYLGLQEFPASWGGSDTTLVQFFWAGTSWANRINLFDVSEAAGGNTTLTTDQSANAQPSKISFSANGGASGGSYPITAIDYEREGWWATTNGTVDYLLFISKTGAITQYPALGGNLAQDSALVLCDSLNLLIALDGGYDSGDFAGNAYRTLHIRDLATGTVTSSLTLGDVGSVAPGYDGEDLNFHTQGPLGLEWVAELGAMFGYDQSTSPPTIRKLTPPAGDPATEQWTWSTVSVAHWDAGDPSGQAELQVSQNSAWSKFRWIPKLHSFVVGTASNRKPQCIRLEGM